MHRSILHSVSMTQYGRSINIHFYPLGRGSKVASGRVGFTILPQGPGPTVPVYSTSPTTFSQGASPPGVACLFVHQRRSPSTGPHRHGLMSVRHSHPCPISSIVRVLTLLAVYTRGTFLPNDPNRQDLILLVCHYDLHG